MAASNALVRCFAGSQPGFTISSAGLVANQTALVSEKLVRKLVVSFAGENYPTPGPNRLLQDAINSGAVSIENVSLLALYQRLAAGALGTPFAATRSWRGSSLQPSESFALVPDPFGGGDPVGVVSALVPDISFVHALAADTEGNLLLAPPFGEGETAAFAARLGVVATVERIVAPDVVQRNASLVKVPAYRVLSVSEAPLGGHPYGLYSPIDEVPGYVEDYAFFADLRAATGNRNDFGRWVAEWILGVRSHGEYVANLGERANELRSAAQAGRWREELTPEVLSAALSPQGWNSNEMMVVAASRAVVDRVKGADSPIIEAGVGFANLAAWLAVSHLRLREGIEADLVAEIGIYGYMPQPGDPFIFSHRNLAGCKSMTGTESILGMYVGGRHNQCVAIIGAAQIDAQGNINSTYGDNGRFLVGSGGANDIASTAKEVIVVTQQSRRRLVKSVPYITSPGDRVSTVVTDKGVFRKMLGEFALVEYFPQKNRTRREILQDIRETCGWDFKEAAEIIESPVPGSDELDRLRLFDIKRDFLGPRPMHTVQETAP